MDQIQKLREELCRIGLEQSARQRQINTSQLVYEQSDTESTTSHVSYTAALSKQLTDSVSVRLDLLETENHRLKKELKKLQSDGQNEVEVVKRTVFDQVG